MTLRREYLFKMRKYKTTNKFLCFHTLSIFEKFFSAEYKLSYNPTFIVGAPRTGSTLLMQLITQSIPTSFFNNLTTSSCQKLGFPLPYTTAIIGKWFGHLTSNLNFTSQEGVIQGRLRPTEGTDIWTFFFGTRRSAVEPDEISKEKKNAIYNAVALTERAYNLPFINKHINLCLRIRIINEIFPTARFIKINRNLVDVAQSLYKIRLGKFGNGYFGPRPKECMDREHADLIDQVCEQIYYIEKNILFERRAVGESKFLDINYEDICKKPHQQVRLISEFINGDSKMVDIPKSIPEKFTFSTGPKSSQDDYNAILLKMNKLRL